MRWRAPPQPPNGIYGFRPVLKTAPRTFYTFEKFLPNFLFLFSFLSRVSGFLCVGIRVSFFFHTVNMLKKLGQVVYCTWNCATVFITEIIEAANVKRRRKKNNKIKISIVFDVLLLSGSAAFRVDKMDYGMLPKKIVHPAGLVDRPVSSSWRSGGRRKWNRFLYTGTVILGFLLHSVYGRTSIEETFFLLLLLYSFFTVSKPNHGTLPPGLFDHKEGKETQRSVRESKYSRKERK